MFEEIVGSSEAICGVTAQVMRVAPSDATVLITGESGTGKELIARAIHKRSGRSRSVFTRMNCAVTPPSLIAAELFGYEKGAFTGAHQRHAGRFEVANHGTMFLDEIGEMPGETQVALLRVLQEREFERVGGTQSIPVDVRVIAATNCDLPSAIRSGRVSSGPVLPVERLSNPRPTSSRASGGYSFAGEVFHRTLRCENGQEDSKGRKADSGASRGLSLAWQYPGASKCHRTRHDLSATPTRSLWKRRGCGRKQNLRSGCSRL